MTYKDDEDNEVNAGLGVLLVIHGTDAWDKTKSAGEQRDLERRATGCGGNMLLTRMMPLTGSL